MKMTYQKRRIAGALALVMVCGALMAVLISINPAYAVTSLPHIEEIVTGLQMDSAEYDILEIVPQAHSGSIGYYVAGQEPTADWQTTLAALETPEERSNYAKTLLDNLKNSGLMSDTANAAPLHSLGDYQEVYPWERASSSYLPLPLSEARTVANVQGKMVADTSAGAYTATTINTIDPNGNASQVQNISYFEKATETAAGDYYYAPNFTLLENTVAETLPAQTAIYTMDDAGNYIYDGTVEYYDVDGTYYYVTQTGAPSATWSAENPYVAVPDAMQPFRDKTDGEVGYFNTQIEGYIYQGDGAGNYRFDASGSDSIRITTTTVYYTGGYENNNWFITKVLDREQSAVAALRGKIKVKSVTPDQVTTVDVQNANMIVLSNGYYYNNHTVAGDAVSVYSMSNTLSADVANAILDKTKQQQNAVILDRALAGRTITMGTLADSLIALSGKSGSYVNDNIFVLDGNDTSVTNVRFSLATKDLNVPFEPASVYTQANGSFYEVYAETTHENFLRQTEDAHTADLLETNASMAQCIRYIINFAGQRSAVQRHALRVLDIEPDSQTSLTETTVRSWYPNDVLTGEDTNGDGTVSETERSNAVEIVTMSTTEFVGKMEDVSENYDVVYIGDRVGSFSDFYKINAYPDMCYTNIGAEVDIGSYKMSGMLDSDYYHYTNSTDYPLLQSSTTTTYRYSGNDLTAKKMTELTEFAAAGHTVIFADELLSDTGWQEDSYTLTAQIKTSVGAPTAAGLTVEPTLISNITGLAADDPVYTYQWYRADRVMTGQTEQTLPYSALAAGNSYYCRVTVNYHGEDFTAKTETVRLSSSAVLTVNGKTSGETIPGDINIKIDFPNKNSVRLTPNYQGDDGNEWNPDDDYLTMNRWDSSATIKINNWAVGQSVTYQFTATDSDWIWGQGWTEIETKSELCTVAKSLTVAAINANTKTSDTKVTQAKAGERIVNTSYVDGASQMYQLINNIKDRANVLRQSATAQNKALTYEYLNLSRPQLHLSEQPPEYDENNKESAEYNISELAYTFQIINTTDPTPVTTTYQLDFYLDTDANGYFDAGESLGDIVCLDKDGNEVEPSALQGGVSADLAPTYTVKRSLPTDMAGYLSWKLQVVKNGEGNQYVHASQIGNAYVKPVAAAKTSITVLQVDSTADEGGYNLEHSETYESLLSSKTVTDDFKVIVYTIYTDDLSELYSMAQDWNWEAEWKEHFRDRQRAGYGYDGTSTAVYGYLYGENGTSGVFDAAKAGDTPRARLSYLLKLFDMLILGFGDCYGNLGENDTALSVADYINTGLPTLVAHDTTSFCNVPYSGYPIVEGRWGSQQATLNDYVWGYGFNTVLRSLVSMDRYGVADEIYGRSEYSSAYSDRSSSGIVAKGYEGLTDAQKNGLISDGYSIAYAPTTTAPDANGSNLRTVDRTQGCSNYALGAQRDTNTITQVNKGQITSYPYNINTDAFDADNAAVGATIDVATTHRQYYQLNMNKGDIAVWYCLGGGQYQMNDAANGYYIYTVGNVTYTGAGHYSSESEVRSHLDEAKLFVNTMIAAYRTERTAPTIDLYNSSSAESTLSSYPLTADYEGTGYAAGLVEKSADCPVYFTINDTNLDGSRVNQIALTYQNPQTGETVTVEDVQVKRADTASGNLNNTSLVSGRIYYFNLPQNLLDAFGEATSRSSMEITVQISTVFSNRDGTKTEASDYQTTSTLSLFKLGLLDLS